MMSSTGFRLTSGKAVLELEKWRKLQHINIITLKEMFTTKAFGDNCEKFWWTKLLKPLAHASVVSMLYSDNIQAIPVNYCGVYPISYRGKFLREKTFADQ